MGFGASCACVRWSAVHSKSSITICGRQTQLFSTLKLRPFLRHSSLLGLTLCLRPILAAIYFAATTNRMGERPEISYKTRCKVLFSGKMASCGYAKLVGGANGSRAHNPAYITSPRSTGQWQQKYKSTPEVSRCSRVSFEREILTSSFSRHGQIGCTNFLWKCGNCTDHFEQFQRNKTRRGNYQFPYRESSVEIYSI